METSSQLEPWRNPIERERVFRPHYRTEQEMPFHPWSHALTVRSFARAKAVTAIALHNMRLNLDVIDLGTLAHDINVWEEPGEDYFCCQTKEQHSAHLARKEAFPKLYTPRPIAEHAIHVIEATERDVRCEDDDEAKCGCQGDMWSVINEDPRPILLGTINHFKETRILAKNPVQGAIDLEELTEHAAGSHEYILGFIEEELGLAPWDVDKDGLTPSQRGRLNTAQLRPRVFPDLMRAIFPDLLAA